MLEALYARLVECRQIQTHAVIIAANPPVFSAGHNLKELVGRAICVRRDSPLSAHRHRQGVSHEDLLTMYASYEFDSGARFK
jgi:enoyl-CoA hydratase/carnithine racemase